MVKSLLQNVSKTFLDFYFRMCCLTHRLEKNNFDVAKLKKKQALSLSASGPKKWHSGSAGILLNLQLSFPELLLNKKVSAILTKF